MSKNKTDVAKTAFGFVPILAVVIFSVVLQFLALPVFFLARSRSEKTA